MTNGQAIVLGVVQGLTEYLPVSSSAHLVLVPKIMGWQLAPQESFIFDVLVQLGTMFGVLIYFSQALRDMAKSVIRGLAINKPFHDSNARMSWLVLLACLPAALVGFSFKGVLAGYFSSPIVACYFLILTGVMLIAGEMLATNAKEFPTKVDALFIGCAQTLALFPGVSRSGSTIAAGMTRGLSRKKAAFFSFFMSVPVMFGASLVVSIDLINNNELVTTMAMPLVCGFLSAALSGYLVIKWFMAFVAKNRLYLFAAYCVLIGAAGIAYFSL